MLLGSSNWRNAGAALNSIEVQRDGHTPPNVYYLMDFFIFSFSFSFPLVAWYYIIIEFYRSAGAPTDAGIEPEKSLPFGAVVHGGHVT